MVDVQSVVTGYAFRFVFTAMFGLFSAAALGSVFMLPGMTLGFVSAVLMRF